MVTGGAADQVCHHGTPGRPGTSHCTPALAARNRLEPSHPSTAATNPDYCFAESAPASGDYTPIWSQSSHGQFSTNSCKQLMEQPTAHVEDIPWPLIWRFRGPLRTSMTVWTALHGGLPTANFLNRRDILSSSHCSICSYYDQSPIHVLRDCPVAAATWKAIMSEREWITFKSILDLKD